MAQRVTIENGKVLATALCDLCYEDTEADETLGFGLDGAGYELDVCDRHADDCRDTMAAMVGMARRAGHGTSSRRAADIQIDNSRCELCDEPMFQPERLQGGGQRRKYCSDRCRTAAHRRPRSATTTRAKNTA